VDRIARGKDGKVERYKHHTNYGSKKQNQQRFNDG
jgi:hypothetical protein